MRVRGDTALRPITDLRKWNALSKTALSPERSIVPWPQPSICPRCGADILLARYPTGGKPIKLEPFPILPKGMCGECKGFGTSTFTGPGTGGRGGQFGDLAGHTVKIRDICSKCGGSGTSGELPDPKHFVLLHSVSGLLRLPARRRMWEAIHRRHRC